MTSRITDMNVFMGAAQSVFVAFKYFNIKNKILSLIVGINADYQKNRYHFIQWRKNKCTTEFLKIILFYYLIQKRI
jgi:hypothetical protein